MIALRGVVVDDIEDHLDAGRVQGLHHPLELLDLLTLLARRRVLVVRREVPDGVVAPVVAQAAVDQVRVVDELMHGHQLHGSHAQREEMVDDGRMCQACVGSPELLRDVGVLLREPLDVDLVDDAVVERDSRRSIALPVEVRADHDRLWHERRAVDVVGRGLRILEAVAEQRLVPTYRSVDGDGVGVEQELRRIAADASAWIVRPVDAVAVALPRADVGRVAVPHPRRHLGEGRAGLGAVVVEEAELDQLGGLREDREVGPYAVVVRAERKRRSWPEVHEADQYASLGSRVEGPARWGLASPPVACSSNSPGEPARSADMAPSQRPPRRDSRPRARTPVERAQEAADVQQRLKREAAERREAAAAKPRPTSPTGRGRVMGRRLTP
ncbi:MAG TPA: hypothetical protein VHJ39_12125 [Solirubrobacteraceae bacterium]|jgi:hypothetical protein|nr:hypothetical protein [Solirubrobacteraceae bacterium]